MAGELVHTLEYEGPGHIGGATDNLAVHKITQADGTGTDGRDNGDVVQHREQLQTRTADKEPQRYHQTQRAAVAGQPLVARVVPSSHSVLLHGQHHLQRMREVVCGFVEQAVAQSGTDDYAEEAVEDQRVELLLGDVLFFI